MAWKTKLRILHSKICHPIVLFFSTFFFPFFAVAVTNHPSNESELQIYRVLQRANLLSYYDTFIAQGKYHGDHTMVQRKEIIFLGWNMQFSYSCQKESSIIHFESESCFINQVYWLFFFAKSDTKFLDLFII